MRAARQTHAAAAVLFLAFWWWAGLGIPTLLATAAIAVLLERQHRLVTPRDLSRLNAAFFTTNGVIAVGFLAVVYTELVVLR
jgi:4-hydroxybenzoate polyprenyltransferase